MPSTEEKPTIQLPEVFHGISRYMVAESINGTIIEVSPRHMSALPSQITIDDYKSLNPDYVGPKTSNRQNLRKEYEGNKFYWVPIE